MGGASEESTSRWARVRARPGWLATLIAGAVVLIVVVLVWFQPQAAFFDTVVDEGFPEGANEPESVADGSGDDAGDDADADADADAGSDADSETEPGEASAARDEPAGAEQLATGTFEGRHNHQVTGSATVYELDDGSRTLRLEPFESENGPDLVVYLTAADHADDDQALGDDFVDLGELKGNVGNQNYDVPADVDLDRYDTAVIWCRRFTVSFGAADFE